MMQTYKKFVSLYAKSIQIYGKYVQKRHASRCSYEILY